MQTSDKPSLIPVPFANSGTKNTIPTDPPDTAGLASLETGFPPVTMTPIAAGGIPPAGQDFNGILYLISAVSRWANAGGSYSYDSGFSTEIGGYPKGATLLNSAGDGFWISLTDNNTADPDAGGAGWVPAFNQGIAALSGLTNANVTLTSAQAAKPIITLAGTLTGNIQIIFPATQQQWLVVNATTGSFTVTCKTAAGTGVAVAQGGGARVYGDGTNIQLPAEQVGTATQATQAAQLGQVQQNYAWNHRIDVLAATGNYTVPANTYWLDVEEWGASGGGGGVSATGNGGGGAGGGGYCRGIMAVTPGQVISGTVGSGGAIDSGTGGGRGGTTTFGALSATGGFGGATGNASTPGAGGAGGTASGGSINLSGQDGTFGGAGSTGSGGSGGSACFGGTGGIGGGPASAGASGAFPGGGTGGHGGGSTGSSPTGRPGYIIIHS